VAKRNLSSVGGFVHDIDFVDTLSTVPENLRLLSDRSLYILQNLSGYDATFLSRYGTIESNNTYIPVVSGTGNAEIVDQTVDVLRRDINSMAIEDTLECICAQLKIIAAGAGAGSVISDECVIGSDEESPDGAEGGSPPGEVLGVPYVAPDLIADRKCIAANYIHDTVRDVVIELDNKDADDYAFAGIGFVLEIVSTVIGGLVAGPIGALAGAVVGSFLTMALALYKASVSLADLRTAILADEESAVCSLYNSITADGARSAYGSHLLAQGASSSEVAFVQNLLSNNVTNLLFFGWGDSEDYLSSYTATVDCSGCGSEDLPWSYSVIGGEDMGSGSLARDGQQRTLTSVLRPGTSYYALYLQLPDEPPYGNRQARVVSVSNWTNLPTSPNYITCHTDAGGIVYLSDTSGSGDPPPSDEFGTWNIVMSSATQFTAEVILFGGLPSPPCT
jgi:hypothetical protein